MNERKVNSNKIRWESGSIISLSLNLTCFTSIIKHFFFQGEKKGRRKIVGNIQNMDHTQNQKKSNDGKHFLRG